jgi:hypothetical protein
MLPTIKFDDQSGSRTVKINDEAPDVFLPVKDAAIELFSLQLGPESPFGVCHVLSKLSRKRL